MTEDSFLHALDLEAADMEIDIPEAEPTSTMEDLAERMRVNKDQSEDLETQVKELKRTFIALSEQLYDKMIEQGLPKIAFRFGSFTRTLKQQCSINPDQQEAAFAALEAHGLGASIKRAIHYQTLNKHYREGELVIEGTSSVFKTWTTKTVAMRRKN